MLRSNRSPELVGLVLAGGRSRRMGVAKESLVFDGRPQLQRAIELFSGLRLPVCVSIRADQAELGELESVSVVQDLPGDGGPASGLLAAWRKYPESALLVLAVDMPLVDSNLLIQLIAARDPKRLATGFRHPDGTLEPLCTIWEPLARPAMEDRGAVGSFSLRMLLESAEVTVLDPADPVHLRNVNTPEDYETVRALLDRRS